MEKKRWSRLVVFVAMILLLSFPIMAYKFQVIKSTVPQINAELDELSTLENVYIINENHIETVNNLLKDKPSSILNDPFTAAEIESLIDNMCSLSLLQKREDSYKAFLANENKLIYQFENILELESLDETGNPESFFIHLQKQVRHKLELTFAAEKSFFLEYIQDKSLLVLKQYKGKSDESRNLLGFMQVTE